MTAYENMSAADLRAELEDWRRRALDYARDFLAARDAGDFGWEAGIEVALRQALSQARRLERMLQLGVAA